MYTVYSSVFQKRKNEHNNYGCCILHLYDAFIIKINIEIFFTIYFLDIENYAISVSPSHNLPITVQSLTCACILLIIGVVLTICVMRLTCMLANTKLFDIIKQQFILFSLINTLFILFTGRGHLAQ